MEKVEAQPFMRSLIIVAVIATAFSSFTLWLLESWIKYPLFLFEIFTIILFYLIINDYDIKLTTKDMGIQNLHLGLFANMLLIISASSLLIINALQIQAEFIQLVLALLCTSLLSGYALLNILGLTRYFSRLETVVLSYILSYAFTGFVTLAAFSIGKDARTSFVLSIFIAVGLISALKHRGHKYSHIPRSLSKNIDSLGLLLAMAFYAISFYFMYPGFAFLPGTDILRHYASSIILARTPDIYIGSVYLLAHLHESMFLTLSTSSLISAQTALVTLNLMLPLTFYVMAKPYLEKINARLPSLATLFWVLFTNSFGGFAWFHFFGLKLSIADQTQLQLLVTTADKTYNGTVYGILGLWYVPATISLVVLMATIFLMCKKEIPTSKYLALFSIMVTTLYLTHVTEAVVFALFLATYGAISRNENLRIDDSIKSSIIGFLFVILIYYIFSLLTPRFIINLSLLISLIGPILALFLSLMFRRVIRPRIPPFRRKLGIDNKSFWKTLILLLLFAYTVAFLSWASLTESFHTWQVDAIGLVPWFTYPLMLGINGLLAIISLYYIIRNTNSYTPIMFFLAFMIFSFVAGKLVSTINLYFFDAGYWEKRFILFIKLSLAVLAPIPVIFLVDRLKKKAFHVNIKTATSVVMIGTIVLLGISTTFLNLEYWNIMANNSAHQPSSNELNAINTFKEILDNDPKAWLATVTDTSAGLATFATPPDTLVLKQLLYTAYGPEMAFTQLYRHPACAHPYIYLHSRDVEYLKKFNDCFLAQYLTTLPLVFNNSEVRIYNASKPSFPQENSNVTLILPYEMFLTQHELLASYYVLSHGFYNYTVAYDLDARALKSPIAVLAFDPLKGKLLSRNFTDNFKNALGNWNIIKGMWKTENGSLIGGDPNKYTEGVILTPLKAQNLTASFTVKPLEGDPQVLNYASLIYSWRDNEHYRLAEVFFHPSGYIYAYFRNVDGTDWAHGTPIPNWPGVNTGVNWSFGEKYHIQVVVQDDLNELYLNGKKVLSANITNIEGLVGLFYGRFNSVAFDDFSVAGSKKLNIRSVEHYVNYMKGGGTLIVLDTNGYESFADILFNIDNQTMTSNLIRGAESHIYLPVDVKVHSLLPLSEDVRTLSYYVTDNEEVPYILEKDVGKGRLTYVNLYPLIEPLKKSDASCRLYPILGNLIDELGLPKFDPETKIVCDGYVEKVSLNKNVTITTESLLFPLEFNMSRVSVTAEGRVYDFENVTSIYIENSLPLSIEAENVVIATGNGLYATMEVNSTFQASSPTGDATLTIMTNNVERIVKNISEVAINPADPIKLLAKTPTIKATEATLHNLFSFGDLHWRTRAYGHDLKVSSSISFHIPVSDTYTMLKDVKIAGSWELDPPLVNFDQTSTIPVAVFWTILLLPIFLAIIFIRMHEKQRRKN